MEYWNDGILVFLKEIFPYALYYEIENEIAYVVAVLPMRRDPLWIKEKLQQRS